MEVRLNLDDLPEYYFSSYRAFDPGEKHVSRVCDHNVLIFMLDGVLRFCEDGREVELTAGEYYVQRRGLYQEGTCPSDSPVYYYIHFAGSYLFDEPSSTEHSLPIRKGTDTAGLVPLFDALEKLNSPDRPSGTSKVEKNALFYSILSKLCQSSEEKTENAVLAPILALLTADLSSPVDLRSIARQCGYCENQLINVFRKHTGKTPYAYVTDLRLDRATRLLWETQMSVSRIAEECGFGDYVNFYKHFKKSTGTSPAKWRKTRRGG